MAHSRGLIGTLRRLVPIAAGLLSSILLAAGPAAAAGTALKLVPAPNPPGAGGADFGGVSAVSPTDAWAVGFTDTGTTTFVGGPVAEHFDGTRWSIVATAPVPAGDDARLQAVAFSGASDGWAVGSDSNFAAGTSGSLIEHFDGTSWTRVPAPAGEPSRAGLASVTVVSAADAWAVGSNANTPLIEHWNGSAWSIVAGPPVGGARLHPGTAPPLYSVTALSATNVWAVGGMGHRAPNPLIEHWDGTAWHQVTQPVHTYASFLISVSAASPTDIWAVGGQTGGTSAPVLLEHFDGTAWTEVPNPQLPAGLAYSSWLNAVTALGHGDVWVVSSAVANQATSQPLALHFDGASWQVIPAQNTPAANGSLE